MIDEFSDIFQQEATDLILQLEEMLLSLEQGSRDKQVIDGIFRVMHTLKGSAGMFGFKNIQDITHEFEGLFDRIRSGELEINREIIDLTLQAKDSIESMLKGKDSQTVLPDISASLKQIVAGSDEELTVTGSGNIFAIYFTPDPAVYERGLDPEKIVSEIKSKGTSHVISHDHEGAGQGNDKKICTTTWEVYLNTSSLLNDIEDIFLFYDPAEFFVVHASETEENLNRIESVLKKINPDVDDVRDHLSIHFSKVDNATHYSKAETSGKQPDVLTQAEKAGESSVSVNVSSIKLDELMNLVSELVTQTATLEACVPKDSSAMLLNTVEQLSKLTKKFRINALDIRLVPVGNLLTRFKRQVRDLSRELNKEVSLILEGHDIEIDKTILKAIEQPLIHVLRNSIDHGIESPEERIKKGKNPEGIIKICAFNSGTSVIMQVQDDGCGINLEKVKTAALKMGYIKAEQQIDDHELLNLILEPGFTTNENVSLVSGRGVGMDVVKKEVNRIGGTLEVFTEKGLGTTITMKLPTTLTIIDTLMIEVGRSVVLVPMLDIEYCYKEDYSLLKKKEHHYIEYKGKLVPFLNLREKFKYGNSDDEENSIVMIINKFDQTYAIIADRIIGEYQAVVKPLGDLFNHLPYFSGASIMVDGRLALILDTNALFGQKEK
ncbi:MAG TPA: chemotaxis protein CheA [Bacteroidales bacterium]|nr:chemotaxis protein CheA [Bacteroidales bacterium]